MKNPAPAANPFAGIIRLKEQDLAQALAAIAECKRTGDDRWLSAHREEAEATAADIARLKTVRVP